MTITEKVRENGYQVTYRRTFTSENGNTTERLTKDLQILFSANYPSDSDYAYDRMEKFFDDNPYLDGEIQ